MRKLRWELDRKEWDAFDENDNLIFYCVSKYDKKIWILVKFGIPFNIKIGYFIDIKKAKKVAELIYNG